MEKQSEQDLLIPISSDECGGSGGEEEADSDEDVITDYRLPSGTEGATEAVQHLSAVAVAAMLPRGPSTTTTAVGGSTLPTISVTPHSPANKSHPVLEDSLQQVRELHDTVQHMRNIAAHGCYGPNSRDFAAFALNPLLAHVARLSASCPALNETVQDLDVLGGSLGSSPLHQPPSRKGSGTQDWLCQPETQRRRSWTALEDLTGNKDKVKHTRQRSISLSSMESEADESSLIDNVDGSTVRLLGPDAPIVVRHRGTRGTAGGASTHSLNEADLQNDFNKLKAKREAEQLRLLPARLPLQKSISTPSIIAVRDLAPEPVLAGAQPTLPLSRPSGTESETEEEGSRSGHAHYDPRSIAHLHQIPYDRHSEKRRKRGSLFFRKKKDKTKKNNHQWMSGCYGSSHICDVCTKPLSNKPALFCESCGTTVHQNTCKDNIQECVKIKTAKSTSKLSSFAVPLTNAKNSISKRGSGSLPGSQSSTTSQILCDDKDSDSHHGHHDSASFPDDVPIVPLEFLSDSPLTAADLCSDLSLGLHDIEPDSWSPYVGKDISRKLKEKEIKRQEHIYEFILTEKHHCMTLLVMQKVFVEGLHKYFHLGPNLERMFPRLGDLTEIHLDLLSQLRQKQRESPIVSSIADILLEQFSNNNAARLKSAYGEFCSRHRDAVEIYKYYLQNDQRFGEFVRHCQTNPLLKKKGIPECILFVTQRLTKYPLLIEPLIKTSKENRQEQESLQKALALVKEVLVEVDAQVAEKEKEDRKLQIYNRIDAKSYTVHIGHKFKKSDILLGNRSLKFEGVAMLMQGRGKMQIVLVIVLSDVLFFLQENSQKYTFFTPDNKAGVVSLQKLLVREKAGQDTRGIYLISSNPADPEMFELKVHKPKDKQVWIQAIREAVQACPEDDEDSLALNSEERQNIMSAKQNQVRHLVGLLRQKDIEQALLLEEKMSLQLRLLAAAGLEPPSPPSYRHLVSENADTGQMWKEVLTAVQEVSQLASSLYTTGTNLSRSVSSAGEHHSDTYVSPVLPRRAETFGGFDNNQQAPPAPPALRHASSGAKKGGVGVSVGTSDLLDNVKPGDARLFERLPYRNCVISGGPLINGNTLNVNIDNQNQSQMTGAPDGPALLTLGREQQYAAIQLSHYVYTLLCIISQLMTTNESLQAQIVTLRGGHDSKQYRHNQQLEELRNLQDKLSVEKTAWAATRDLEAKELEEKRAELLRLQEQVRAEQHDITQQREQLYRKMEMLTSQGLLISPNVAIPVSGLAEDVTSEDSSPQSSDSSSATSAVSSSASNQGQSTSERRKDSKWTKGSTQVKQHLPLNLISATNQQKVSQNVSIKQQIPLKLASKLSSDVAKSNSGTHQMLPLKLSQDEKVRRTSTSGYQRLGSDNSFSPPSEESTPTTAMHAHSRTGSSPAMMQASSPNSVSPGQCQSHSSAKATRTHTYPKLPDKFKVRNDQQTPAEEEVIYF